VSRRVRPEVYSVSGARPGRSDDLAIRQRRYLISMSVRTICFVLAVVLTGWLRWTCVAAALVLPYIAVVMANAVGSATPATPAPYLPPQASLGSAERQPLDGPDSASRR
jgi:hypothetical protein